MTNQLILVVDDIADQRAIAATLLTHAGYRVIEADGIAEADHLIGELDPDLILLDINMPDKTGVEWLREVEDRSDPLRQPVVVYTSFGDIYDRELRDLGVHSIIDKSSTPQQFLKAIAVTLPPLESA